MATEIKIPRPEGTPVSEQSVPLTIEQMKVQMKEAIEVEELKVRLQELAYKYVSYEVLKRQSLAQLDILSNPNPTEEDLLDMQEQLDAMKAKKNESKPSNKEAETK